MRPCRSGGTTSARIRRNTAKATTHASGIGLLVSGGARAWSPARSRWSTPPWRCSPFITATAAASCQHLSGETLLFQEYALGRSAVGRIHNGLEEAALSV